MWRWLSCAVNFILLWKFSQNFQKFFHMLDSTERKIEKANLFISWSSWNYSYDEIRKLQFSWVVFWSEAKPLYLLFSLIWVLKLFIFKHIKQSTTSVLFKLLFSVLCLWNKLNVSRKLLLNFSSLCSLMCTNWLSFASLCHFYEKLQGKLFSLEM